MRKMTLRYCGTLTGLLAPLLLSSCEDGAEVCSTETSDDGSSSIVCLPVGGLGSSTLAIRRAEPAGDQCANGGERIDTGFDDNGNNLLDTSEIDVSAYICNGEDGVGVTGPIGATGADGDDGVGATGLGFNSLVLVDPEGGESCEFDGFALVIGVDDGASGETEAVAGDGLLDDDEIDHVEVVCSGDPGPIGVTGATGATGAGETGATGVAGTNGNDGAFGTNGNNGATGATGNDGATGVTGTDGTNGADGATGSDGTNGADGATGATGATGAAGTDGVNGATGVTGTDGVNGATGATGVTGADGATGADGVTGATGPTGVTGAGGPGQIINGFFETGDLSGWAASANFSTIVTRGDRLSGDFSARSEFRNGVTGTLSQIVDLTGVSEVGLSFHVRILPSNELSDVQVFLEVRDAVTYQILTDQQISSGDLRDGTDTEPTLDLTPALGRFVIISFKWSQNEGEDGSAIVFDEVEIVPLLPG
jgi:collagen triple helix repeat protein